MASSTYGASVSAWACNAGDSLSGSTCTKTTASNATPNYSCASGTLSGSTCIGGRKQSETMYVYLAGKQIAEVTAGVTQYPHTDALGSPVAHSSAAGAVLNRTRFEPYGFPAAGTKPSKATSVIGFTGHVQDSETDLVYMQQRYYDPIAARFLSVDPTTTSLSNGAGFGRYTYVDNNPYRKVDPDGMCEKPTGSNICTREPANSSTTPSASQGGGGLEKIRGKPQASSNTPTHASTSQRIATEAAAQPDVESVHLNRNLRNITNDPNMPNIRPDVAVVKNTGELDMTEVRSAGQTTQELRIKLENARAAMPGVQGRNIVIKPDPVIRGSAGGAGSVSRGLGALGIVFMILHEAINAWGDSRMTDRQRFEKQCEESGMCA